MSCSTIHCIRHAQGYHNISEANHGMHDPLLTPLGEEQCRALGQKFPYHNVDLIVASPLKRTIYTALLSFEDELKKNKNLKVIGLPELQETSDLPCDTGSSKEELEKEFEGKPLDLSLVLPGWNSKKGKWAPSSQAIEDRALEARKWLMARPEKEIVLVTHGGFLHYFTEDWTDMAKFAGTGWANTEYRSYIFGSHEPTKGHLIETQTSRARREAKSLEKEERTDLAEPSSKGRDESNASYSHSAQIQAKV